MSSALPAGKYSLQLGGVDVLDEPSTHQLITVSTLSAQGHVIDQLAGYKKAYFNFEQSTIRLRVEDVSFTNRHRLARSRMVVRFSLTGRFIYRDEYLALNLDFLNEDRLASAGQGIYDFVCIIKEVGADGSRTLSHKWRSCALDAASFYKSVTVRPREDILQLNHTYVLEIHNIRTPNTSYYNLSLSLHNAQGGAILQHAAVPLPERFAAPRFDYIQLVLKQKSYNFVGERAALTFQIQFEAGEINVHSRIVVSFPKYYPPDFGAQLPYCEIQGTYSRCEFTDIRELTIRDIPRQITAHTLFSLLIQGVPVPAESNAVADSFFLALYATFEAAQALKLGEVLDQPSALVATDRIQIDYVNATSDIWIVKNNYKIEFILLDNDVANAGQNAALVL